mgnify:CR=1 FL=1
MPLQQFAGPAPDISGIGWPRSGDRPVLTLSMLIGGLRPPNLTVQEQGFLLSAKNHFFIFGGSGTSCAYFFFKSLGCSGTCILFFSRASGSPGLAYFFHVHVRKTIPTFCWVLFFPELRRILFFSHALDQRSRAYFFSQLRQFPKI